MPETTISQCSHLANYFDDQNKSVQRHWIVVRWQHSALVGGADKNFLAGGAIVTSRLQQQRQQTESAHCSVLTASQYSCSAGSDVDSSCMPLQVTQSSAHRVLAQPKYWLSFLFLRPFSTEKRKENENADVFFGRKIIKCVFWRRKIKRKRNSVGL